MLYLLELCTFGDSNKLTANQLYMDQRTLTTIYAFTTHGTGGNPAGVVLDLGDELAEREMQEIAGEAGYSETAFIKPSEVADRKVLFFTPTTQVNMCGHATLAAWGWMQITGKVRPGVYDQELAGGEVVRVEVLGSGEVYTHLPLPQFKQHLAADEVRELLSWFSELPGLPAQIVNTGFDDLMLPLEAERFAQVKFENIAAAEISDFQRRHGLEGLHLFTLETGESGYKAFVKNCDPLNGIYPYDAATGTSNGALLAYLLRHGLVTQTQAGRGIEIKQFGVNNRNSVLHVVARTDGGSPGEIVELKVGGSVRIAKTFC